MKKILLLLAGITLFGGGIYSQTCNCYAVNADSLFPRVPLTQGTDIGYPPYYHCNNCSSQAIILPFNFCFYGKNYDTVFVNNKGNLTFNRPDFKFSSKGFPFGNDTLMLAPYYTDVDDSPVIVLQHIVADVSYTLTATHMIVQWSTVGYNIFDCDLYNNFQVTITNGADSILPTGNNVSYCYYIMQWASGDSGSMGFNGTPGKIGVNKGDHVHYAQFGAFDLHGYNYSGPYDTNGQLYWLDTKSLIFNTCVSGNNLPPVIVNSDSCPIDTICVVDTLSFGTTFLCSQIGQKATLSVSCPGITNFITDTASGNSLFHIKTTLVPTLADTGTHIITVTATDNNIPPLTNSRKYKVIINSCGDTNRTGIHEISNPNSFTIYPNPNNGKFVIELGNNKWENGNSQIAIYNTLGQQIYSQLSTFNSPLSVDLSSQPGGVYFCRIITNNGSLAREGKFVIQK